MRQVWLVLLILSVSLVLAGCSPATILEYKAKAGIQVITDDITSAIYLDDQYLDNTPLIEKDLKPGEYSLRIEPVDTTYVPYETTVKLNKGMLTVVTWKPGTRPELSGGVIYEMEPIKEKKTAQVSFVTVPDGAIVALANHEKKFSPVTFSEVGAGDIEYEVTIPSYETQRHTLNVQPGHHMIVNVKLAKLVPIEDTVPNVTQTETQPAQVTQLGSQLNATDSAQDSRVVLINPTGLIQDGNEVLRVREAPEIDSPEIGLALVGETYPYLGDTSNSWYKISIDNKEGWVSAEFAEITTP